MLAPELSIRFRTPKPKMIPRSENPFHSPASVRGDRRAAKGFALIIVLLLMVLLATISIGLLTLSSVNFRSSTADDARLTAMGNARLAMMLALGDLQKHAGPDSRITASASVLGNSPAQPHLTGVWDAKPADPESPGDFSKAAKNLGFRGWLCSTKLPGEASDIAYAETAAEDSEILISRKVAGDVSAEVSADRVTVRGPSQGMPGGSFAYAVFDEGVKARVNLGKSAPSGGLADQTGALRSGQRP